MTDPMTRYAQHGLRLCSRRNGQLDRAIKGWYLNLGTKNKIRKTDGQRINHIIAVAREKLVRYLLNHYDQVSGGSTSWPGVALAAKCQVVSVLHS